MIEEAAVVVEAVHDPIADVEGEMTGVRISAPSCFRTPLFLVRGVDAIQTGFFETTHDEPLPLVINQPLPITVFSRRHYALLVTCESAASDSGDTLVECPLVLVHDRTEQLLAVFTALISAEGGSSFADDAAPRLLWAGDIDRDLELDLLLDLTNHYNVKAPTLFLSSEASEGELVAEVASLFLTGC